MKNHILKRWKEMTVSPYKLDEFIYAVNTYNVTKKQLAYFLKDPSEDIKYIQNNFFRNW